MPALNSPQSIRKAIFVPVLTIVYMLGWKILELLCFSTSILDSRNSLNIIYQLIVLSLNGQTLKKILEMVLAWPNIPISQTSAVLQCFPTGSPFNFVKWQSNFECYMQSLFPSMTVTRKEINEHYKTQTGTSICIIPLSESTLSLILLETAFPTKKYCFRRGPPELNFTLENMADDVGAHSRVLRLFSWTLSGSFLLLQLREPGTRDPVITRPFSPFSFSGTGQMDQLGSLVRAVFNWVS